MNKSGFKEVPFITRQLTHIWDRSPDPWFVKDKESRFIYANTKFIKVIKLPENFNIIGYSVDELPIPVNGFAHHFKEHDRRVLECMQKVCSVGTYPQGNGRPPKSYFCEKYPLMSEDNHCIGIISHARELEHFTVYHYIKDNIPTSASLRPPNDLLNEKEWMVIFLFCCGMNNNETSIEMNVSCHSVEKHFESIYQKLSVSSLTELRLLCKEKGYDLYVPSRYFLSIGHFIL
ncbi:helix-turn-helix transcriptional regulator [Photorhabdus bodei]|uniref:Helix-turn-helix transcriptional regulator n=1 Tax=Photorhabdus bodei TaxID=2029681 RepID=A0A329X2X9_9GAMM|nr:PAS domain-containing protein [Photorhabdus bodei]NDK99717.1 PAS domain-containing protein [Photorhabdus bodei]NDL04801.1 PAS domain-containing protein [Photorhabdus bodei]NDL08438.1 PAS domain-containing protein [Photorhabdus bodei]RAX11269.1 helix-turn-helix transcriptional regulator [Photorhabdus bodei]